MKKLASLLTINGLVPTYESSTSLETTVSEATLYCTLQSVCLKVNVNESLK